MDREERRHAERRCWVQGSWFRVLFLVIGSWVCRFLHLRTQNRTQHLEHETQNLIAIGLRASL
jgi:hypothetical protein